MVVIPVLLNSVAPEPIHGRAGLGCALAARVGRSSLRHCPALPLWSWQDDIPWRWISWGSATAALVWLIASMAFSWYAANFGTFNKTYGSLGAGIGFMTWIWISAIVILIGEEVNEILDAARKPEKEAGKAHPLGVPGKASCRSA